MLDLPSERSVLHIMKNSKDNLKHLLITLQRLKSLNHYLEHFLDPSLKSYCKAVELNNGCLVIAVENSSLGTLLRYQTGALLSQLRSVKGLHGLASIKVIVRPLSDFAFEKREQAILEERKLPSQAGTMLENLAESIEDAELKQALINLAKKART